MKRFGIFIILVISFVTLYDGKNIWGEEKITKERITQMIKELSIEKRPHVKARIIEELGNLKAEEAIPEVINALQDKEWTIKWQACESLGKIKDKRAVSPLIKKLEDKKEDWSIRIRAAKALVNIGYSEAFLPLVEALRYESEIERKLEDLYSPPRHDYISADEYVEREFAETLKIFVENSERKDIYISHLVKLLNEKKLSNIFRYRLGLILGELEIKDSIPVLIECLKEAPRGEFRSHAAYFLGELNAKEAISYLKQALKDKYLTIGRRVSKEVGEEIIAYRKIEKNKKIISTIIIENKGKYYRVRNFAVRDAAAGALKKLGIKIEREENEYRVIDQIPKR